MSPSGLHVLLNGSSPHPATRGKLVAWYVAAQKEGVSRPDVSKADVDAALRLLVQYVRQDARSAVQAKRLREIVQRLEAECVPASDEQT